MKQFNLKEYLENPSRKIVTRDGRNVRIICTDAKGNFPIVALIETLDGTTEVPHKFKKNGYFFTGNEDYYLNLFFTPEKHERWLNLYKEDNNIYASMDTFKTKEKAEALSCSSCIATVKVEWEE